MFNKFKKEGTTEGDKKNGRRILEKVDELLMK
jgi:hypothetical protein